MGISFLKRKKFELAVPQRKTKVIVPFSESALVEELSAGEVIDIYEKGVLHTKHYSTENVLEAVREFTADKSKRKIYIRNPFAQDYVQELTTYYVCIIREVNKEKIIEIEKKMKSEEIPLVAEDLSSESLDYDKKNTRDISVKKLTIVMRKD